MNLIPYSAQTVLFECKIGLNESDQVSYMKYGSMLVAP